MACPVTAITLVRFCLYASWKRCSMLPCSCWLPATAAALPLLLLPLLDTSASTASTALVKRAHR